MKLNEKNLSSNIVYYHDTWCSIHWFLCDLIGNLQNHISYVLDLKFLFIIYYIINVSVFLVPDIIALSNSLPHS